MPKLHAESLGFIVVAETLLVPFDLRANTNTQVR